MKNEETFDEPNEAKSFGFCQLGADGTNQGKIDQQNQGSYKPQWMPKEAGYGGQQQREYEEQRYEMAQGKGTHLTSVIDSHDIPFAIAKVVVEKLVEGFAGIIGAIGVWHKVNLPAATENAFVQFDVLIAGQPLVKETVFVENIASPTTERHRVHFTNLSDAGAEKCIADVDLWEYIYQLLFFHVFQEQKYF